MADDTRSEADQGSGASQSTADQVRQTFQDKVIEPAQRAGEALKASGQKIVENGTQVGVRMIDQAEQNAREAFTALREAAAATDLSEVMRIQGEYLRQQSDRSLAQAREIGELIMQFGRDAVSTLRGDGQGGGRSGGQP